MAAARFRPRGQDDLAPSGARARIEANLAALRLLRHLQAEGRPATEAEQAILARWSSWGAAPGVFLDSRDPQTGELLPAAARYERERAELRDLLSPAEYAAADLTTVNAHYTDHVLAATMWEGLRQLGFAGGAVLEPGCGSGNFLGTAPPDAVMVGVERDPTTAAIAQHLYPDAEIRVESFADTPIAPGEFEAAIGNVPFGAGPVPLVLADPLHNAAGHVIHNHFIVKSLDAVRPGGFVLLLTSRFTMDSLGEQARADMAERADLVAAIRLPQRAHRRAAGTDVVTDLLVLRRREDGREPTKPAWRHTVPVDVQGTQVPINEYFAERPEMTLGTFAIQRGQFTDHDFTVLPAPEANVAEEMAATLAAVARHAASQGLIQPPDAPSAIRRPAGVRIAGADALRHEGLIVAHDDGTFGVVHHGVEQPHAVAPEQAGELRALVGVRDTLTALLAAEAATSEDTNEIAGLRAQLGERYDAYVDAYGPVNRFTWTPRLRAAAPAGRALRAGLIAAGHAWPSGGKLILRQDQSGAGDIPQWAQRETLLAEGHAVLKDGELRMRATKAAKQVRTRLLTEGYAEVAGGSLSYDATGRALVAAASPEAVNRTRVSPDLGGFLTDPFAPAVLALEHFDQDTGTARKAAIFTERAIAARTPPERVADPADAVAVSVDRVGRVDLDLIAGLLDVADTQAARAQLGELVYDEPGTDRLVPRAEYLSGNVRAKLAKAADLAAEDERYAVNVAALKAVLPPDLDAGDIDARLGSPWLSADIVQQGLRHVLADNTIVVTRGVGVSWQIENGRWDTVKACEVFGTERMDALVLASHLLEGRPIRVSPDFNPDDSIGKRRRAMAMAAEETLAAQAKAEELNAAFVEWLWADPDRAAALTTRYNTLFNSLVARGYDDAKPALPGLSQAITPRPHQLAAVARIVAEPTVLLAHEVGAGKTLEMIMGCMELRRLGLARKPAIVVPNHMVEQFSREFLQAYPQARVLAIAGRDLDKAQRTRTVARLATGSWDAVIMPRTVFERIPMSVKRQKAYLEEELAEFDAWLAANTTLGDTRIVKRMAARREARAERIVRRIERARDTGLCFEDTGIDYLMVDEAHGYKNREILSNNQELAIAGSIRSADLAMKLAYLREAHGKRVATFATATPISNSIAEMYGMLAYLGRDLLREAGVDHFDAWAANHTSVVSDVEVSPDGGVRTKSRVASFRNCPEMMRVWRTIADVKTAEDLKLPVPALVGGAAEVVAVPSTPEQVAYMAEISRRADRVRMRVVEPTVDNLLKLSSDGRAAALDVRLVGGEPTTAGKLAAAAERVAALWREHKDDLFHQRDEGGKPRVSASGDPVSEELPGSLQLVFCDIGTPSERSRKRGGWNAYDELRALLIAHGLPAEAIRFMQDARTDQDKADLFAAARAGRVAVLIGSTELMGTGTNVQKRAIALHHLDCPWRPADVAQREGRILRQGNQHAEVHVIRYVTEGSFDAYMWQGIERKQGFISQAMKGQLDAREIENIDEAALSYSEVKALASGDIRLLAKAKADGEVRNLERLAAAHRRSQQSLRGLVHSGEERLAVLTDRIARFEASIARRVDTRGAAFRMVVGDRKFADRPEAAAALMALLTDRHFGPGAADVVGAAAEPEMVGRLGGFELSSRRDGAVVDLILSGVTDVGGDAAVWVGRSVLTEGPASAQLGALSRLENRIAGLDRRRDDAVAERNEIRAEVAQARAEIGKPFAKADALIAARAEAARLAEELASSVTEPAAAVAAPEPTGEALSPAEQAALTSIAATAFAPSAADSRGDGRPMLDGESQRPPDQLAPAPSPAPARVKPSYADRPSIVAAQRDIEAALAALLTELSAAEDPEPAAVARNLEVGGAIRRLRARDQMDTPEDVAALLRHLADVARRATAGGVEPLAGAAAQAVRLIDEHCQRADYTDPDLEAWRWPPTSGISLAAAPSPPVPDADPAPESPMVEQPTAPPAPAEPVVIEHTVEQTTVLGVGPDDARVHDALRAAMFEPAADGADVWRLPADWSHLERSTRASQISISLNQLGRPFTKVSDPPAPKPTPQPPTPAPAPVEQLDFLDERGSAAPAAGPVPDAAPLAEEALDENDLQPSERAVVVPDKPQAVAVPRESEQPAGPPSQVPASSPAAVADAGADPLASILTLAEQAYDRAGLEQTGQSILGHAAAWDATTSAAWVNRLGADPVADAFAEAVLAVREAPDLPLAGELATLADALRQHAGLYQRLAQATLPFGRHLGGFPDARLDLQPLRRLLAECETHATRLEATAEVVATAAAGATRLSPETHPVEAALARLLRVPAATPSIDAEQVTDPELRHMYEALLTLRQRGDEVSMRAVATEAARGSGTPVSPDAIATIIAAGLCMPGSLVKQPSTGAGQQRTMTAATPTAAGLTPPASKPASAKPATPPSVERALDEVADAVARARSGSGGNSGDALRTLEADLARIRSENRKLWQALTDANTAGVPARPAPAPREVEPADDVTPALAELDAKTETLPATSEGRRMDAIRAALGDWWQAVSDATHACARELFADTAFHRAVTTIVAHAYQAISRLSFTLSARLSALSNHTSAAAQAVRRVHLAADAKAARLLGDNARADFTDVVAALNALRRDLAATPTAEPPSGPTPARPALPADVLAQLDAIHQQLAAAARPAATPSPKHSMPRPGAAARPQPQPHSRRVPASPPHRVA